MGAGYILTYYCTLIALTLYYATNSFASVLPWSKCKPAWGSGCIDSSLTVSNVAVDKNSTSSSEFYFLYEFLFSSPISKSSKVFFRKEVIKEKDHIEDGIGSPDWQLTLWLLLAWICIFLVVVKGIKSSGKVSYFLAIFPYVIILTLLIHTCTLEGSFDGILYFLRPDFKRILEPKVNKN